MNFRLENYKTTGSLRKKRVRRLIWMISGSFFLVVALFVGGLYAILNVSWFRVQIFDVPDLPGISRSEILDAVRSQMSENYLESWFGPENILFWKMGESPDSVQRFPALENLKVETDFWRRAVKISVSERRLWGVVCDRSESSCYGLDQNGVIFARVPSVSGSLILKIIDSGGRTFLLGQSVFSKPVWFSDLKDTVDVLNQAGYKVISVSLSDVSLREWTAHLAGGLDFYFGLEFTPENLDSILKSLGSRLDLKKITYVDFRVPNRIYYK